MSRERKRKVNRLAFLGALAGGLAHEVKTPLSTMNVNLQLLKEDWEKATTPRELRALKRLEILQREVERLGSIVNDFLHFARGFSMEMELDHPNEVLRELIDFLEPEAIRLKIRMYAFLAPDLPLIMMDKKYMQRALLNLVHNAFQALQEVEEGRREIVLRSRRKPDSVEVEVTDTGPGISAEHLEKIFQVFFTTKKDGTGMGLPTVRRIVEEHEGTVSVHSEVGKGTSFLLAFPLPEAPETRVPAGDPAP